MYVYDIYQQYKIQKFKILKNINIKTQIDSMEILWFYKQNQIWNFWWEILKTSIWHAGDQPVLTSRSLMFLHPRCNLHYLYYSIFGKNQIAPELILNLKIV